MQIRTIREKQSFSVRGKAVLGASTLSMGSTVENRYLFYNLYSLL